MQTKEEGDNLCGNRLLDFKSNASISKSFSFTVLKFEAMAGRRQKLSRSSNNRHTLFDQSEWVRLRRVLLPPKLHHLPFVNNIGSPVLLEICASTLALLCHIDGLMQVLQQQRSYHRHIRKQEGGRRQCINTYRSQQSSASSSHPNARQVSNVVHQRPSPMSK